MTENQQQEHRLIAQFAITRILPSMADFAKANNLTASVEVGMLRYLLLWLFAAGVSKEAVVGLVESAYDIHLKAAELAQSPAETPSLAPPATDEPAEELPANVLRFGKKPK